MKNVTFIATTVAILLVVAAISTPVTAQPAEQTSDAAVAEESFEVYPIAIFPFQERGSEAVELGGKVTNLLFAHLVTNPDLFLVEREDIDKLFTEQELSRSGLINPAQANQVGYLTGAKILVTGSVVVVDDSLYVIAKVIGTETSRVLGASAKGRVGDDLDSLVEQLAEKVAQTVTTKATSLVAKPVTKEDRLAALAKTLGEGKRPSVWIEVEERHIGQATIDPAAETELAMICKELGFEVIDHKAGNRNAADVALIGEGFSQFASRHGNLISVKARLELKAIDRATGKVLAVDRQVSVAVDLAEQIAGKTALQNAAASIANRLLPKILVEE